MNITKNQIIEKLTREFNYPQAGAELMASKLLTIDSQLQKEFITWWQTGNIPTISIEGFTIERFIKEHQANIFAAILNLDWLIREPEKAKKAFAEGYDYI